MPKYLREPSKKFCEICKGVDGCAGKKTGVKPATAPCPFVILPYDSPEFREMEKYLRMDPFEIEMSKRKKEEE
jgi:hypothetical protein